MTFLEPVDLDELTLRTRAESLCARPVDACVPVSGGGNNRVHHVQCAGGTYALKLYPRTGGDLRDRLAAEHAAISFLNAHGVRCVPEAHGIARYDEADLGLYEWIEGAPILSPTVEDIVEAVQFVKQLADLRFEKAAEEIRTASEACLSAGELLRQVEVRLDRLHQAADGHAGLKRLMIGDLAPKASSWSVRLRDAYARLGWELDQDIKQEHQTLSPSDFGFHNARRRESGAIVFLDFEYFGWDDPVRLVCDFLLHPGMELSQPARARFIDGVMGLFSNDPAFTHRLEHLYPLIGLRWGLILLNEFLPERWARRAYATGEADHEEVRQQQLQKAQSLLAYLGDGKGGLPIAN